MPGDTTRTDGTTRRDTLGDRPPVAIHVRCSDCGNEFRAQDKDAGRDVFCPACGRPVAVPEAADPYGMPAPRDPDFATARDRGRPAGTSGKAITSFVLGLMSILCFLNLFTGIPAIILGILGLGDTDERRGRAGGRGLAIAGIVLGSIGIVTIPCMVALLLPAVQAAREAARRVQCLNNEKEIGLGLENYETREGHFPPAALTSNDGRPLLSWRVAILPYVGQEALYREFHLDEPWDSPHNKGLIPRMPDFYTCPSRPAGEKAQGLTTYRVPVGPGTLFPEGRPTSRRDVTDGQNATIAVVETNDAVPWTAPDELRLDPDAPPGALGVGSKHPGVFQALFVDGSVKALRSNIPPDALKALFTIHGGEVVDPEIYSGTTSRPR